MWVRVYRGHTFTSHALVYEAVEQRATVVTEGRAGVGVDLKPMFCPWILDRRKVPMKKRAGLFEDTFHPSITFHNPF